MFKTISLQDWLVPKLRFGSHSEISFGGLKMTQGCLVVALLNRVLCFCSLGFRSASIFALRFGAIYFGREILRPDEERSN